jgi:hypothetical protein
MYGRFAADPDVQMLAFEDQRHFIMLLCLKCNGLIDKPYQDHVRRERVIASALGLEPMWAAEAKRRLLEAELIDEAWQPVSWGKLQFVSDTSTSRVRRHRERKKHQCNVSETAPDTDTDTDTDKNTTVASRPCETPEFAEFKSLYPKRAGSQPWSNALKAINARLRVGHSWTEILDGVRRYAAFVRATGKEGTEYVMQAATFCGPSKRFLEPWDTPPPPPTKAEARLRANLSAFDEAKQHLFGGGQH